MRKINDPSTTKGAVVCGAFAAGGVAISLSVYMCKVWGEGGHLEDMGPRGHLK